MLGAVIGDIIGSSYEFNNIKSKNFPLWTNQSRITDDTVCTIAVADSLIHNKDITNTLRSWCRRYPVGYGQKFKNWIDAPLPTPYNSWGNGAVMRISPVGFLYDDFNTSLKKGMEITNITHNHPDTAKAVEAYLMTMALIKSGVATQAIKEVIQTKYQYNMNRSVDKIRSTYDKFYVRCNKTVPEAIICALDAVSFEDAIRNAISLGGDSDTLACMTGALAELRFGIPPEMTRSALRYLDTGMKQVLRKLYQTPTQINTRRTPCPFPINNYERLF